MTRREDRLRIYTASSWRNERYPVVPERLKAEGFNVYDFRNPSDAWNGFHWSDIDPGWENWSAEKYREILRSDPLCEKGFMSDKAALDWCDVGVLVLPCGRSAHLEAGYLIGQTKRVYFLLDEAPEPELMYLLGEDLILSLENLVGELFLDEEEEKILRPVRIGRGQQTRDRGIQKHYDFKLSPE